MKKITFLTLIFLSLAFLVLAVAPVVHGGLDDVGYINACQTITISGEYTLSSSFSGEGDCITINTNDIVLDGAGYTITGNGSDSGVISYGNTNITIKNFGGITNFTTGVQSISNTNILVYNITTYNNTASGIQTSNEQNIDFTGITSYNCLTGLNLNNCDYCNVSYSSIYNNSGTGIQYTSSEEVFIFENNLSNNLNGLLSMSSHNANIYNNNIVSSIGLGLLFNTIDNASVYNNNIDACGSNGIVIHGESNGNNLTNNTISNSVDYDLNIYGRNVSNTNLIDQEIETYFIYDSTVNFIDTIYGNIQYAESITGTGTNLNSDIQISDNSIYVNSSQVGLNKSATIEIKSLIYFIQPHLLKDGVRCDNDPSLCNITSYTGGILTADVSSFSNYTTTATPTSPPSQSNWNPTNGTALTTATTTLTFNIDLTGDCKWGTTDLNYTSMINDCTGDGTTSISCAITGMSTGINNIYTSCNSTTGYYDNETTNTLTQYPVTIVIGGGGDTSSDDNTTTPVNVTIIIDDNATEDEIIEIIDDWDENLPQCDIEITPSTVFIGLNSPLSEEITISNSMDSSYSPQLVFSPVGGKKDYRKQMLISNEIGTVYPNTFKTFGIRYSGTSDEAGQNKIYFVGKNCSSLVMTININQENILTTLNGLWDSNLSFLDNIVNFFNSPLIKGIGWYKVWMVFMMWLFIMLMITSKKMRTESNIGGMNTVMLIVLFNISITFVITIFTLVFSKGWFG